jgi:hypothetical protein
MQIRGLNKRPAQIAGSSFMQCIRLPLKKKDAVSALW